MNEAKQQVSQCQVIGRPRIKTWDDYRQGCIDTYAGGHRSDGHLEAFQHGMATVFNLLQAEFPPAQLCKAAPELLEACQTFAEWMKREDEGLPKEIQRDTPDGEQAWRRWFYTNIELCDRAQHQARAAIAKAT